MPRRARVASRHRRCAPDSAGDVLARALQPVAEAVPHARRRPDRGVPRPRGARPHRDHRLRGDARVPAAARARREHPPAARGGRARSTAASSASRPRAAGCPSAPTGRADRGPRGRPRRRRPSAAASTSTWPMRASASSSSTRTSPPAPGRWASPARAAIGLECRRGKRCPGGGPALAVSGVPRVASRGKGASVAAFVRDPKASTQVWSRLEGYPGDGAYLEFHKIRWPGGLKLWRVTGSVGGPRRQGAVRPADARRRAPMRTPSTSRGSSTRSPPRSRASHRRCWSAPFDTELFGHWWFEGPHFLEETYRAAARASRRATRAPASAHLLSTRRAARIRLPAGSWGANGDFSMWLSEQTAWTWERLWPLEERLLGRGAGGARPTRLRRTRAGAGRARAAAGPVVRLAVHHLHRRRGRLRRAPLHRPLR